MYWKTRWEPSQDGTNTANRTLVCYKDTWANTQIDPVGADATWRDPRFGDLGHGPENSLMGTLYKANSVDLAIKVERRRKGSCALAKHQPGVAGSRRRRRHWPPTRSATSRTRISTTAIRPAGLVRMSTTIGPTSGVPDGLRQTRVVPGTTTHHVTQYRAASGALVFSAGTIQWSWGSDSDHDGADIQPADPRIRQATLNILADMGADADDARRRPGARDQVRPTRPPRRRRSRSRRPARMSRPGVWSPSRAQRPMSAAG